MKKLLVILLCIAMLTTVLVSCSKKKPLEISEEDAFAVVSELVPLSYELNVIFFGEGLPTSDNGSYEDTAYVEVDLTRSKHSSIASIKNAARQVYSKKYLDSIYINMFVGSHSSNDDGLLDNDVSPRYKEIGGKLMIDASYDKLDIMGRLTVKSTEILKKTPEYVSVKAICLDEGGNELEKTIFITLEKGVWLLDGPTY